MAPLHSIVAPSILSADFLHLEDDILAVDQAGCDWLHVDIMDGHFVPNITMGPGIVKTIRKRFPDLYLDVHLMVSEPIKWVRDFYKAGADLITFHYEACHSAEDAVEVLKAIKARGGHAGISIKPETKVDVLFPILNNPEALVDTVLIMTVHPGFGGQRFLQDMLQKVKKLREKYPELCIEVDGGINALTSKMSANAGANAVVAGSAIFGQADRKGVIEAIRNNMSSAYEPNPKRPTSLPRSTLASSGTGAAGLLSPTGEGSGPGAMPLSPGPLVSDPKTVAE